MTGEGHYPPIHGAAAKGWFTSVSILVAAKVCGYLTTSSPPLPSALPSLLPSLAAPFLPFLCAYSNPCE